VDLTERIAAVRDRIAGAGGDPDRILLVAVTKTFGADVCRAAVAAGLHDLGENRAQELLAKAPDVDGARWHFIGRLQTNKVRHLAPHVALWESVDRVELADEIASRTHHRADVLVQVNISGEQQKGGCAPEETGALVRHAQDVGLTVRGLMGIGPIGEPEAARPGFRRLRALADDLGLPERSMGMSGDLEIAVQEGSTMVRVGSSLFGPRRSAEVRPD
jgi:hypothetical protein